MQVQGPERLKYYASVGTYLRSSLAHLLAARLGAAAVSAVVSLVSARLLGPEGRGTVAFALGTGGLLAALAIAGLPFGISRAVRNGQMLAARRALRQWSGAATSLAGLALLAVAVAKSGLGPLGRAEVTLTVLGTLSAAIGLVSARTIQLLGYSQRYLSITALQTGIYGLAFAAIIYRISVTALIAVWAASMAIGGAISAVALRRYIRDSNSAISSTSRIDCRATRPIWRDSLSAHVASVGGQLLYRSDVVLLGLMAPERDVGLYVLAVSIVEVAWIAPEALAMQSAARSSAVTSNEELIPLRKRYARRAASASALAAIGCTAVAYLLTATVLTEFKPSSTISLALIPGIIAGGVVRTNAAIASGAGLNSATAKIGVTSGFLTLAYLPLVSAAGLWGAVTGSVLTYSVLAIVSTREVSRHGRAS